MASWGKLKKAVSEGGSSESGSSEGGGAEERGSGSGYSSGDGSVFEFSGWVYHLGVNSIGREYCHLRFLRIRGKRVEMYKRDPQDKPGAKPIRKGGIGPTLMVEEIGRRKVNSGDLYALRFYNRLDETKKGVIACGTAADARKWVEAFDHAKQEVERELSKGVSPRSKLGMDDEINLEGHRPRVRKYAHGLKKLIRIGQGPEVLVRQTSALNNTGSSDVYYEAYGGDATETHEWKCVRTINGVRIFEDVTSFESEKGVLVKAVGVVDATADTVFEVIMSTNRHQRYEWDTLTGDLELIESVTGHYDVVYGVFDPRYLNWWQTKRDFVFSREWFRGQDGTYTILQNPAALKKQPPKSGYQRTKINASAWEIKNLNSTSSKRVARCLVTQMLDINTKGWFKWKKNFDPKFERTIPFALLGQVAGLKEYIGANPALTFNSTTTVTHSKISDESASNEEYYEDAEASEEFYDAIGDESSSDSEDSDEETGVVEKKKYKLKNVSWAIAGLALKQMSAFNGNDKELNANVTPVNLESLGLHGTMQQGKDGNDSNCWTSPTGAGFMIRGKTYLKDGVKVKGGEPLLKLLAVDWFKTERTIDNVALHPKCLVQSEAGKKIPFLVVVNLQVPAKPNYSLVLYYAADRPVNKNSLLAKFVDGTDMFRDSRFKLIPSIVEGYWMVKRAVGTKACLLGKAVTCKYLRQDNFLEIDVDIGSSSVARSVIGLVLGYVTSLVVDLAILIEGKEEDELPEYILGTVRLNRFKVDSAVNLDE